MNNNTLPSAERAISPLSGALILAAVLIGGLFYVKWMPYYHRAFVASANHSIGNSILMGTADAAPPPSLKAAVDYAFAYGKAIWQAMVLGLLVGSALQEFIPRAWVGRVLGRSGFGSVVSGGLLAVPGMMCTCCAAPVVIGLRRQGASAAAAVGCGYLVGRFSSAEEREILGAQVPANAEALRVSQPSIKGWMLRFLRLAVGLIPEYLILVLLLGATRAWLFPHIGPAIGNEFHWVALMSAVGLLSVIPTAGEVPIVQAMLALGIGVGPAAALMMTLAPVSLPSLVMTARAFPPRTLALVAAVVFIFGLIAGLLAIGLNF